MKKSKQLIKFILAFVITFAIPVLYFGLISKNVPSLLWLTKLFGHHLFMAIIAFLIVVLISKKGKPASALLFGGILLVLSAF